MLKLLGPLVKKVMVLILLVPQILTGEPAPVDMNTSQLPTESNNYIESAAVSTDLLMAHVDKVVDGDTIYITAEGFENVKLRLIGIDTPESVHSDSSKNTEEGVIASDFLKSLLSDQTVYIEFDQELFDPYDRLLGYVYYNEQMVNETLLSLGLAHVTIYEPNNLYEKEFYEVEQTAKNNKIGFWGTGFYAE